MSSKINLSVIKTSLDRLYTDTLTVFEYKPEVDPITKRTVQKLVPIENLKDVACRVSYSRGHDSGSNENKAANPADFDVLIFLDVAYDIKKGSLIEAKRLADGGKIVLDTIYGECGKADIYTSHQQLPVNFKERA